MDYLCELPNDAARRRALTSLPPTLHATYQRILRRVNESNKEVQELVGRALQWLLFSLDTLSTADLCVAVSVNVGDNLLDRSAIPDGDEILRRCGSLVRLSASGDHLELAHFTVKEYLLRVEESPDTAFDMYHFASDLADLELAKVCLTYLTFDNKDCSQESQKNNCDKTFNGQDPFRFYAIEYWDEHAWPHLSEPEVSCLVKQHLYPSKPHSFISWAHKRKFYFEDDENDDIDSASPLHFAAALLLPEVCAWLLQHGCNVNQSNIAFGDPLQCALDAESLVDFKTSERQSLQSATVKLMLDAGANLDSSPNGCSPICIAVVHNDIDSCVELLLRGAIIDAETANQLSERPDQAGKILDRIGANLIREKDRALLLGAALRTEGIDSDSLTTPRAQLDEASIGTYVDRFMNAAKHGQIDVIKQSVDYYKLHIDRLDDYGCSALHAAASKDQIEIVRYLLERGANCEMADCRGRTVLHHSLDTSSGCLAIILDYVIDIDVGDDQGLTVWHLATQRCNTQVLRLLSSFTIDQKPYANLKAKDGRTPIHYAAAAGSQETLALLLDHCDNQIVSDTCFTGSTALHYAVGSGSLDAVSFLMNLKYDVKALKLDGSSMLHCACAYPFLGKRVALLDLLLDRGIDPRGTRNDGTIPAALLISEGQKIRNDLKDHTVFMDILEKVTRDVYSVQLVDGSKASALYQVCQLKLPQTTDSSIDGTLIYEDIRWRQETLELLVKTGIDKSSQDQIRSMAMDVMIESWANVVRPHKYENEYHKADLISQMFTQQLDSIHDKKLKVGKCTDPLLLCVALTWRQEDLALKILENSPNVDKKAYGYGGMSPLEKACSSGCSDKLLKELVQRSKTDRGAPGSSFRLFRAACQGDNAEAMVDSLLEIGFDLNDQDPDGWTALMCAAIAGSITVAEMMIQNGANVLSTNLDGWNCTHIACHFGEAGMLHFLIDTIPSWDTRMTIKRGSDWLEDATVGHLAASYDNGSLEYLLQNGSLTNVDSLTRHHESLLFIAAKFGNSRGVSSLLDRKADYTVASDHGGASALHIAARCGWNEVLKTFIQMGCNLSLLDQFGSTPALTACT